jgi:HSP20 family protein
VFGTAARPAAMPMDAYRQGDAFYICFDLPGIRAESIDLTVEQNVLTVRAERAPARPEDAEMIVSERPYGTLPGRSSSARPWTPSTSARITPPAY